jgi:hypothetical protein
LEFEHCLRAETNEAVTIARCTVHSCKYYKPWVNRGDTQENVESPEDKDFQLDSVASRTMTARIDSFL